MHYSDRRSQHLLIKYSDRLAEAGIAASVGILGIRAQPLGDSYDNALAETVIGLFKAKIIHRRTREAVALATLEWVDWFNNRHPLEPIGNIPLAEAEVRFYAKTEEHAMVA